MSVIGELSRHLDGVIASLEESPGPAASRLREALAAARPRSDRDLSESAERILSILRENGLDRDDETSPLEGLAPRARDAADTLASLSRIVLGR